MLTREAMLRKLHVRDGYYRRRARESFAEFLPYTEPDASLAAELSTLTDPVRLTSAPASGAA